VCPCLSCIRPFWSPFSSFLSCRHRRHQSLLIFSSAKTPSKLTIAIVRLPVVTLISHRNRQSKSYPVDYLPILTLLHTSLKQNAFPVPTGLVGGARSFWCFCAELHNRRECNQTHLTICSPVLTLYVQQALGNATVVTTNPIGVQYEAVTPPNAFTTFAYPNGGNVKGSIKAVANDGGTGVKFQITFSNLPPSGGPFRESLPPFTSILVALGGV
jgi:hypothetical protein